jgi:uncharacterized protein (TIGR02284 family)
MHGLSRTDVRRRKLEEWKMKSHDDVLRQIVRIARSGNEFFVDTYPGVRDPEIRSAFAYLSEVKTRMIADLAPFMPKESGPSEQASSDRTSPAVALQRLYADMHGKFRSDAPATAAKALSLGEDQLIRLVERAFEETQLPDLKELLKAYYAQLLICRDAMSRLHSRLAA